MSSSRDSKLNNLSSDGPTQRSNFIRLAAYQVLMRIGWMFKTESIIMPAFMDLIGGSGWQRGCLPMLNRLGQSIPPLLFSDRIRNVRLKKKALCLCTALAGFCFILLAICWWGSGGEERVWWPWLFLTVYASFFVVSGVNQLLFNTLTGKLVVAEKRGRLAAAGSLIGGALFTVLAFLLLQPWLESTPPQFGLIFGFSGLAMVSSVGIAWWFIEVADEEKSSLRSGIEIIASARSIVVQDRNFGFLAIAGAMFGMSITLSPHYQAIARENLATGYETLLYWIVAQQVGAALLSVPAGWYADRFGNRSILRILMGLLCLAPTMLIVLQWFDSPFQIFYLVIFFLLGLTPLAFRFFNNYTLEITSPEKHPAYLSTISCCISLPVIVSSLLVGWLIDVIGLSAVFGTVLSLLLVGWAATFFLVEPRDADH